MATTTSAAARRARASTSARVVAHLAVGAGYCSSTPKAPRVGRIRRGRRRRPRCRAARRACARRRSSAGGTSAATKKRVAVARARRAGSSVIASAAAVASSSSDALAIAMPVRSQTIVWKLSSASSRPCEISAWYGVYAVYQAGFSRMLRRMTPGVMRAVVALADERLQHPVLRGDRLQAARAPRPRSAAPAARAARARRIAGGHDRVDQRRARRRSPARRASPAWSAGVVPMWRATKRVVLLERRRACRRGGSGSTSWRHPGVRGGDRRRRVATDSGVADALPRRPRRRAAPASAPASAGLQPEQPRRVGVLVDRLRRARRARR